MLRRREQLPSFSRKAGPGGRDISGTERDIPFGSQRSNDFLESQVWICQVLDHVPHSDHIVALGREFSRVDVAIGNLDVQSGARLFGGILDDLDSLDLEAMLFGHRKKPAEGASDVQQCSTRTPSLDKLHFALVIEPVWIMLRIQRGSILVPA